MKAIRMFALVLALMLVLTACGGSSEMAMDMAAPAAPMEEMKGESAAGMLTGDSLSRNDTAAENRKLIKTVNLNAETENLDDLLTAVENKLTELGGYAENREIYNGSAYSDRRYRRAEMTVRIPAEKIDRFVEEIGDISNIVSSNESIEDVTLQYVDTESRMKALTTEQDRLLELLAQAENMNDLLEIEARLTEVRYELERVTSRLRTLDNQVSYATVHLSITEVQEYTPVAEETVWQRISSGFRRSISGVTEGIVDFFVWVLVYSPYLVVWGILITAAALLLRRRKHRKAARQPKVQENKAEGE